MSQQITLVTGVGVGVGGRLPQPRTHSDVFPPSGDRGLMRWLVAGTCVMMSNGSVPQPQTLLDEL